MPIESNRFTWVNCDMSSNQLDHNSRPLSQCNQWECSFSHEDYCNLPEIPNSSDTVTNWTNQTTVPVPHDTVNSLTAVPALYTSVTNQTSALTNQSTVPDSSGIVTNQPRFSITNLRTIRLHFLPCLS